MIKTKTIITLVSLWLFSQTAFAWLPEPATHSYTMWYGFLHIGDKHDVLTQQSNNHYQLNSHAKSAGIAKITNYQINMKSHFKIGENGLQSSYFARKEIRNDKVKKDIELQMDENGQTVTAKDGRVWQVRSGVIIDDIILPLALQYDVSSKPQQSDFHYQVADGKKIAQQHFKKNEATETITLDGVDIETVKLTKQFKEKKNKTLTIWLAKSLDYLPIYIKQSGDDKFEYKYDIDKTIIAKLKTANND